MLHMFVQTKVYICHARPLLEPGAVLTAHLVVAHAKAVRQARSGRGIAPLPIIILVVASHLVLWYPANQRVVGAAVFGGQRLEAL